MIYLKCHTSKGIIISETTVEDVYVCFGSLISKSVPFLCALARILIYVSLFQSNMMDSTWVFSSKKTFSFYVFAFAIVIITKNNSYLSLSLILLANKLMELRSYFMCIDGKSSNKNGSKLFLDLPLEFISETLIMYWVNSIIQRHTSFTIQTLVPCRVQGQYNSISIW